MKLGEETYLVRSRVKNGRKKAASMVIIITINVVHEVQNKYKHKRKAKRKAKKYRKAKKHDSYNVTLRTNVL